MQESHKLSSWEFLILFLDFSSAGQFQPCNLNNKAENAFI